MALLLALVGTDAAAEPRGPAPTGTFVGDSGKLELEYLGEGTVKVALKTRFCELRDDDAVTFQYPHVAVHDDQQGTLLVVFVEKRQVVVYGDEQRLRAGHCKDGFDVTGVYRRRPAR